jgi:NAD-dependent deacetylase
VPEVIERAMQAAEEADLLLAIGTTLNVYPVANAVPLAKDAGARVVIVNGERTAMDEVADCVLRGAIGEILPKLVEKL